MKICIVGAGAVGGAIGGWLGARLPAGEIQLSALARGATLQALRQGPLTVTASPVMAAVAGGERWEARLRASDDPAELGVQDVIVIAVKGPALAAVAPAVKALSGPDTQVVVAMNGVPWWFFDGLGGPCNGLHLASVDPGDVIRAHIPTERVIGCVVHLSASTPAPAQVHMAQGRRLILGEPGGGESVRVRELAALFGRAGFETECSPRIQRDIWFKLWGNMTVNPISALTGATTDLIMADDLVVGILDAVMLEAREIGTRIGIPIDQQPSDRHVITRRLGAFKPSMLQDVEAGRPIETDALLGAVREIGQHIGLPTPHLDGLLGLTRLMARARGL
jgi:2-dehydropantoate 2-reductase